ncbi:MAG: hypothetical protein A3H97_00785 [Acidobacteria bacterium RIFCSPLOWO2_02_FULL_65_29]|nr:MAG: hypothetical protein A3H97_00785 [Acidobacteria bacterium RIFCSPLOWO2_02_FULL_65_29]
MLVAAIVHGVLRCDLAVVNRYGTLIVIAGVAVDYWPVLTTSKADDLSFWRSQEGHDATRSAIVVVCLGTLVQGFGDWMVGLLPYITAAC